MGQFAKSRGHPSVWLSWSCPLTSLLTEYHSGLHLPVASLCDKATWEITLMEDTQAILASGVGGPSGPRSYSTGICPAPAVAGTLVPGFPLTHRYPRFLCLCLWNLEMALGGHGPLPLCRATSQRRSPPPPHGALHLHPQPWGPPHCLQGGALGFGSPREAKESCPGAGEAPAPERRARQACRGCPRVPVLLFSYAYLLGMDRSVHTST